MTSTIYAVGIAATSAMLGVALALISAASGTDFGPWAAGGPGAVAVGALAWVVRDFRSGRIVAFPVADVVRRLEALEKQAEEREDAYRIWIGTRR